ncbi:DUF2865 domain-containing protein [Hoeflea sp. YIM 152468]|uniref:DUF2865 domain-containing protein n=1 Tax=Hoeflea sp. YIM 152468 TaxID=3031759 RepID=UPI0023DBA249|nr:DUF2865 domain-containing protein [Hoeflea sp. YIM 152468]MDF1607416.1 DUF2865 domain-containing protein [Hoeflea sp. YIM 152468]
MRRVFGRCSMILLALGLAGTSAAQASNVCTRLQAQLGNAAATAGSSAKFQRYADAAVRQGQQIRQVRADLSRFGCRSGSFIVRGGQNAKACAKLGAAHVKMRANLDALERKRDSYASRDSKLAVRRIEAALRANDCDGRRARVQAAKLKGEQAALSRPSRKPAGAVSVVRTQRNRVERAASAGRSDTNRARIVIEPKASRGGNYRTLCVRSCDGFFFPVSSAAAASDFARDERTCQMMCPGIKTELYFHSALGQESQDMVSARTRTPYTEMPNAFAYRNAGAPMSKACGCNMAAFYKEMQRREALLNGETSGDEAVTTWVRPFSRPDPGEDPETALEADIHLNLRDVAAVLAASTAERPLTEDRQHVRMVGPTFLPDQSDHLDLKAGGQPLIR